jgi:hypothetical protein
MNEIYYDLQPVSLSEVITVRLIITAVHVLDHTRLANYDQYV